MIKVIRIRIMLHWEITTRCEIALSGEDNYYSDGLMFPHINCDVTRKKGDVYITIPHVYMYLYYHLIHILLQSILPDLILWCSCRLRVLT